MRYETPAVRRMGWRITLTLIRPTTLPDAKFDSMMGFLRQNRGRFSRRARTNEFAQLIDEEAACVEGIYQDLLLEFDQADG